MDDNESCGSCFNLKNWAGVNYETSMAFSLYFVTKKEVNINILHTWESIWSSLVMSGYTPSITIKSVQQKKFKIEIML